MVLEATVICVDNSEWMRNGDYPPTRFQAQADAVNLICGAKTQSNPENTVGVLTMAGKGVRVLVTPTADLGKILSSMHGVEIAGATNLLYGLQVAQLALKHRQNKNQRQRIVLFAGSSVECASDTLVSIGKKLKKNNVALDIVSFGDEDEEKAGKLQALLEAANSNDNSHLVHVPPGPMVLSDVLISSPIFTGDGEGGSGFAAAAAAGAAAAAAAGGGGGYDFGVDPNLDPELALALRVSMEEERARQEAAARKESEEGGPSEGGGGGVGGGGSPMEGVAVVTGGASEAAGGLQSMDEESLLLERALALSMAEGAAPASEDAVMETGGGDAEAELALALEMSMHDSLPAGAGGGAGDHMSSVLSDRMFVDSVLASLPGVDPNDPSVRDVLAALKPPQEDKGEGEHNDKKPGGS